MSSKIKNPPLFALPVAINNYNEAIPPLQGCIHGLESVSKYLQKENKFFEVNIKKLLDKEATKEAT